MEERYIATFVLHAIGDTIGFKNGEWEFNYYKYLKNLTLNTINEILYEFIALGGVNDIDLKTWNVSDDTIFNIAVADSILYFHEKGIKNILDKVASSFKVVATNINTESKKRYMGDATKRYIYQISKGKDGRDLPYDSTSGGNGAAMRSASIGLAYHSDKDIDTLIDLAIESSRLTHNSPIGWLGGLVTALFTSYAIKQIDISEWVFKMLKVIESEKVKKYIRKKYEEDELADYNQFINQWKKYIDLRFDDKKPIRTRAHTNLVYRGRFHYENFTLNTKGNIIGDSGFSATIMAYDSLLDCMGRWETLLIYSAIHIGDSDTVGSIACAWFGAYYGMSNVPENNYKYLEFKKYLFDLGTLFYKKFYKNEKLPEKDITFNLKDIKELKRIGYKK